MSRSAIAIVALAFAGAGLAGCVGSSGSGGGSTTTAAASASGQTFTIREQEFSLSPATVKIVKPGSYRFKAVNAGSIPHALEIEGNGVEEETDTIQPGSSAMLTVDLAKPGSYELYCPIDSHRKDGMDGSIQVGSGSGSMEHTTTSSGVPGY
jgi:uncharacterized cupredoxin-like copper-binding protein